MTIPRRRPEPLRTEREGRTVGIFLPHAGNGGAERVGVLLAGALAQRGVQAHLVLGRAEGEHLAALDPRVEVVDLRAPRTLVAGAGLARWLRRAKPDALVAGIWHANAVAAVAARAVRARTRLVLWEHNTLTPKVRGARRRERLLLTPTVRATYGLADELVAVSAGVAADLAGVLHVPEERVRVVPNPVVSDDLRRRAARPTGDPWFAPGAPPVVLGVGRLEPHKGFDTLLTAVAPVLRNGAARLVVLGEGPQRATLETRAQELGIAAAVRLPGFVADPYPYLARAGVYALASAYEGLPTALIEALSLGTPVVATDCPSGPRELLDGGRYGRLVPVGDAGSLGEAIRATLSRPCHPAPPSAWAPYTTAAAAERWLELLTPEAVHP